MQNAAVFIIVSLAFLALLKRYLPVRIRHAFSRRLLLLCRYLGLNKTAAWLAEKSIAQSGACGSCSNCHATAPTKTDAFSGTPEALKKTMKRTATSTEKNKP
ncbi:hypothetical protein RGU70_13960 [Herbaspirillum sp. RTI4]|uniref:DUF6587 family protein n=1 Tax=Herbaspirillum sp. RTI4 TaxID=3048640 RepID=UPI002AB3E60C|nr:DUF6587 family protein [Herbaspirillum sp. RTI4]MDY7579419.1 hypothetical protein [Herbaspirillum sp. RTI4]MEA9980333.1 hypothetical protein [Herbaspirillum sp. RTI4]